MDTIWKILIAAFIASVVIFLQILACLIGPDGGHWILMIILIPLILSPVPWFVRVLEVFHAFSPFIGPLDN